MTKKNLLRRFWRAALTLLFGAAVFWACLVPLRAVLHLHEQEHLFRWTSAYVRQQMATAEGWRELLVSFVVQFFYWGWLGAAVVAVLSVAVQGLAWRLMRLCRLCSGWLYGLSFVPSALLLWLVFVPRQYRTDSLFREAICYDYLVRAQRWDAILWKSFRQPPETKNGVWCTNYALAKKGRLLTQMFDFYQDSPSGLLMDAGRMDPLSLYSMGDIMMDLGLVNNAQRMAFDALVQLPHYHKSGRLCQRLAETNLVNGDKRVARKYLHFLRPTLFYGRWAKERLEGKRDERTERLKTLRTTTDTELGYSQGHALERLVAEHADNTLARDYLLAYEMLRLDHEKVLTATKEILAREQWQVPKAVQECVVGYWMLTRQEGDSLPFPIDRDVYATTMQFLQTVNATGDRHHPSLNQPPFNHSYWHYQAKAKTQLEIGK